MTERNPTAEAFEGPCLLSWRGTDDVVTSVGPFSRERAESLVEVYGRMYPQSSCWVQPLPSEVESLRMGRVRRSRALPVLPGSNEDH